MFINLYGVAQTRKEKSQDSYREIKKLEIKNETKECTFVPDFSKTQKITSKYLEKKAEKEKPQRNLDDLEFLTNSRKRKHERNESRLS